MGSVCICLKSTISIRPSTPKTFLEAANSSANQGLPRVKPTDFTCESSPPNKKSARSSLLLVSTHRSSMRVESVSKDGSPTINRVNQTMQRDVMYPDVNCKVSIRFLPKKVPNIPPGLSLEAKQEFQTEPAGCRSPSLKMKKTTATVLESRQAGLGEETNMQGTNQYPVSRKFRHLSTEQLDDHQINKISKKKKLSQFSELRKPAVAAPKRELPIKIRDRTVSMPAVLISHPPRTKTKPAKDSKDPTCLVGPNSESVSPRSANRHQILLGAESGTHEASNSDLSSPANAHGASHKLGSPKSKRPKSAFRTAPYNKGHLNLMEVGNDLCLGEPSSVLSDSPQLVRKGPRNSQTFSKPHLAKYLPSSQRYQLSQVDCMNKVGLKAASSANSEHLGSLIPSTKSLNGADSVTCPNTNTSRPVEQALTISHSKTPTIICNRQAELSFCAISEKSGEQSDMLHLNIQRSLDIDLAD
jgi:hypothetical protein